MITCREEEGRCESTFGLFHISSQLCFGLDEQGEAGEAGTKAGARTQGAPRLTGVRNGTHTGRVPLQGKALWARACLAGSGHSEVRTEGHLKRTLSMEVRTCRASSGNVSCLV